MRVVDRSCRRRRPAPGVRRTGRHARDAHGLAGDRPPVVLGEAPGDLARARRRPATGCGRRRRARWPRSCRSRRRSPSRCSSPSGGHDDDRRDADEDPEHGEHGARLVARDGAEGEAQRAEEHRVIGPPSPRARPSEPAAHGGRDDERDERQRRPERGHRGSRPPAGPRRRVRGRDPDGSGTETEASTTE